MPVRGDEELRRILQTDPVTVVGCSATPGKDAHAIPRYLLAHGYDIIPVNPNREEVLGLPAYDHLADVPGPIAIIDVFRPSAEVAGIIDTAIERADVAVVWLQLGIHDDDAVEHAERAGIRVVQDRCMMVEHRRLIATPR